MLKICLISTCLSHILESVKNPNDITNFYAFRSLNTKLERLETRGLIKIRENQRKEVCLDFSGRDQFVRTGFIDFPLEEILETFKDEEVQDLTVTKMAIKNESLYEIVQENELYPTPIPSEQVAVFEFSRNSNTSKESEIRRHIIGKMKWQIENLRFRPATLDLIGIYTLKDWRKEQNNQIEKFKDDKVLLRRIMNEIFELDGLGKIRYYETSTTNTYVLKECEDI